MVQKINGKELNSLVKNNSSPLIIDCFTDWCGPCKRSSPMFDSLSRKFTNARFFKINTDEERAVAHAFKIKVIPTFFILRGNKIIKKVEGADMARLESEIRSEIKLTYQT